MQRGVKLLSTGLTDWLSQNRDQLQSLPPNDSVQGGKAAPHSSVVAQLAVGASRHDVRSFSSNISSREGLVVVQFNDQLYSTLGIHDMRLEHHTAGLSTSFIADAVLDSAVPYQAVPVGKHLLFEKLQSCRQTHQVGRCSFAHQ